MERFMDGQSMVHVVWELLPEYTLCRADKQ
jgi:hypothetical protein